MSKTWREFPSKEMRSKAVVECMVVRPATTGNESGDDQDYESAKHAPNPFMSEKDSPSSQLTDAWVWLM